ncbi:probable manganese-transporting ATPase PDR2, partial [Tanacetum coccineum]
VFARVAPEQKELIMTIFKSLGRITLMCGDGTNDVGALKQEHVGVALLNDKPSVATMSEAKTNFSSITTGESMTPAEVQMQKLKQMMDEVNKGDDGWSAPLVKLGDTSMASSFSARHASVSPTTDIIRKGVARW